MISPKLTVTICEDEMLVATMMADYCHELGYSVLDLLDGSEDFEEIVGRKKPDLLLMDINLSGKSGISLYQSVRHLKIPVIFITAYSDDKHLTEALELRPAGYLVKPVTKAQLKAQLSQAVVHIGEDDYLVMTAAGQKYRIKTSEILFLESARNYTHIELIDGQVIKVRMTLSCLRGMLPTDRFMATHRSYVINVMHLLQYAGDFCTMSNKERIPVGRQHRQPLQNLFPDS
ncbi:LytR/AlgR family response regulator transcription factor [Marinoscillum sp.]|uniref:LytR/AlgR family response regulator transcription factor n=1 Tax=Marinoscillum sp. TaxID=2024838 RepID=UPI003BAC04DC